MRTIVLITAAASAVLALTTVRAEAVPEELGLSARVTDNGSPINGAYTFAIRIFPAASGGTPVWTESDAATAVDGLVYLTLGDQAPLDAGILDGGPLWIELQVGSTTLSPRLAVTSAAYAVRAGVAEDAERLGGMPSTAFAAAGHNHNGSYLPVGPSLVCTGTNKVTGINASTGSVTCGADVDTNTIVVPGVGLSQSGAAFNVNFAGSGNASTAARSNHDHAGTYLPVSASSQCGPTDKMWGINTVTGAVMCAADQDTNTTYTAGNGISLGGLSGNQFSVVFAGTGGAQSAARSDHNHATTTCPTGYTTHGSTVGGVTTVVCVRAVSATVNWVTAAKTCVSSYGADLCTHRQIMRARAINSFSISSGYWLADRMGQNTAYYTTVSGNNDYFDGVGDVTSSRSGYYCCLERQWW